MEIPTKTWQILIKGHVAWNIVWYMKTYNEAALAKQNSSTHKFKRMSAITQQISFSIRQSMKTDSVTR